MDAYARGYAEGRAIRKRGSEQFRAAIAQATSLVDAAYRPINDLIWGGSAVPASLWKKRDEAEEFARGLKAGARDEREAAEVSGSTVVVDYSPARLSAADAKRLMVRADMAHSKSLLRWGRTSPVTAAARTALITAEALVALVARGDAEGRVIAGLRAKLATESNAADRMFVEGPPRGGFLGR